MRSRPPRIGDSIADISIGDTGELSFSVAILVEFDSSDNIFIASSGEDYTYDEVILLDDAITGLQAASSWLSLSSAISADNENGIEDAMGLIEFYSPAQKKFGWSMIPLNDRKIITDRNLRETH